MARQQKQFEAQSSWDDEAENVYFDEYDDYGDYSINQRSGGGGSTTKPEKRQAKRGGGSANVYSSKHIRAKASQRIARK